MKESINGIKIVVSDHVPDNTIVVNKNTYNKLKETTAYLNLAVTEDVKQY